MRGILPFSDVFPDLGMVLTLNDDGKRGIPVTCFFQVVKKSRHFIEAAYLLQSSFVSWLIALVDHPKREVF